MENELFLNSGIPPPSAAWHSLPVSSDQSLDCIFRSADQSPAVQFDSALSSMVSSPAASNSNLSNDNFVIRELIGKLGNIGNSGEISPHSRRFFGSAAAVAAATNTRTPLNSPPKLNLGQSGPLNSPEFLADPGFAERAARFSCFGSRSFNGRTAQLVLKQSTELQYRSNPLMGNGKLPRVSSSPSLKARNQQPQDQTELANSQEESTVSEQNPIGENGLKTLPEPNPRKRKAVTKAKGKESAPTTPSSKDDDSNVKRCKENGSVKAEEEAKGSPQKPPEPPKDYIHVRARRGQATDSHSLAERVRREKISERMKLLQDLVPGCNKVTGKALMLDEIINYVQSLQQQVEFLSMKLASVNTMDSLTSKDIFGSNNSSAPRPIFPLDSSASGFFGHQNEAVDPIGSALCRNLSLQLPQLDEGFGQAASQYMTFCEDDLQSIVQMGFSQNIHGSSQEPSQMKIEL